MKRKDEEEEEEMEEGVSKMRARYRLLGSPFLTPLEHASIPIQKRSTRTHILLVFHFPRLGASMITLFYMEASSLTEEPGEVAGMLGGFSIILFPGG